MENHLDRSSVNVIASLIAAVVFLLIVSAPVLAQRSGTPAKSRTEVEANRRATTEQDLLLRGAVRDETYETEEETARRRVILEQASEDFGKIQALNDNILGILKAKVAFNYKSIGEMTAEIRKRAKRFKESTGLPPPTDDPAQQKKLEEISKAEMKDALQMLNERINSFVENPLFQTPQWIDVKLGAKASRDLVTIIELSGQIKKNAEKLSKASK